MNCEYVASCYIYIYIYIFFFFLSGEKHASVALRVALVNLQFIFSTAIDGKIKAWLYDTLGSRVDYDAPGRWCTTMLYSADGSR